MAEPAPSSVSSVDFEALLAQLAREPTLDPLVALHWTKFQAFVGYLFTCAGYTPVDVGREFFPAGVGVDYNLFADPAKEHLLARVEVRKYNPDSPLDADAVFAFAGKLGARDAGGVPGFLVTTSSFTGPAYEAERQHPNLVTLIDGAHLLRYLTYVYGSRVPQADRRLAVRAPLPPTWLRTADTTQRPDRATTRVLTVGNNRGGVGKTVTALELGIGLAKRGKRVLAVDLDGQGSLTLTLPPPQAAPPKKGGKKGGAAPLPLAPAPPPPIGDISHYFASAVRPRAERVPLATLVHDTPFTHLWVIPAGQLLHEAAGKVVRSNLHRMDTGGSAHPQDELAFVEAIADVAQHGAPDGQPYDWILLDTPPAQSRYTRAALAAAHHVLACVEVEVFSAQGVNGLLDTADAMQALMGTGSTVIGALITRFPTRPKAAVRDARVALIDKLALQGVEVLGEIPIDDSVDLSTRNTVRGGLLGAVKGLFGFASSPAAAAYDRLIDRLL